MSPAADSPAVFGPSFNTESYDRIYENPFLRVRQNPLSTFSIDVDTASYALCRRFIRGGYLPPIGAVRMEEFMRDEVLVAEAAFMSFREERGHAYTLKDQEETARVKQRPQPGSCLQCHASVLPAYRKAGFNPVAIASNIELGTPSWFSSGGISLGCRNKCALA